MYNSIPKTSKCESYIYWDVDDKIPTFDSIYCYNCYLEDETESKAEILFMVSADNEVHIQGSCSKHGSGTLSKFKKEMREKYIATSQKEMEVILHNFAIECLMRL